MDNSKDKKMHKKSFYKWKSKPGELPSSIIPIVILQGNDYEMGYQYGQQAGQYIIVVKEDKWASTLEKFRREEVLRELKGYHYYIRKYAPEIIEMMRGMADGATAAGYPLSYSDVLLMNNDARIPTPTSIYPLCAEDEELPGELCSSWSAWGNSTNGSLICGNCCDVRFLPMVAIVAFPDVGNRFISVTNHAGQLAGTFSMNSKGVFIGRSSGYGHSSGQPKRAIDTDYGITYQCGTQNLIRFANNADEVKKILFSWHLADSLNWLVSDIKGNSFVAEVTAAIKGIRKPGDFGENDFIYATNNYFNTEMRDAILGEKFIPHAGWLSSKTPATISSVARNKEMWNMFHKYHGKVDLDFAKMIWRFSGNPLPYSIFFGNKNQGTCDDEWKDSYCKTQDKTWDQKICNLDNEHVAIALPDDGDNGVSYVCTGPASRVAYPLYLRGGHWYQIKGTHSFYQLALASSPSKVVKAAHRVAHECIAKAYNKLMWLNYTVNGYVALNNLYVKANTEYYEGVNWANKANLASDDEALFYYAKAATAFTCSQAHANQLKNILDPPPTSPEDLGL